MRDLSKIAYKIEKLLDIGLIISAYWKIENIDCNCQLVCVTRMCRKIWL